MGWILLVAILGLPVVEIALFVEAVRHIGLLATVAAAIAAGVVGIALMKRQGLAAAMRARDQLDRGEIPMHEVFDGLCLVVAGGLFLLPGFFTDLVAFPLLFPPVRALLRRWLSARAVVVGSDGRARGHGRPRVIEAEYKVVTPDDEPKR